MSKTADVRTEIVFTESVLSRRGEILRQINLCDKILSRDPSLGRDSPIALWRQQLVIGLDKDRVLPVSGESKQGLTLLPQVSGNGYYSYSPSSNQFGTTSTIEALLTVGRQWLLNSVPEFGIGDISLQQGGTMPGHTTGHQHGRNIDVRPMRIDGQAKPVAWQDPAYNRSWTQSLVDNFRAHPNCTKIFFNDSQINGVQPLDGHDNHLHIEMKL